MPSPSTPVLVDSQKSLWAAAADGILSSVDLNAKFQMRRDASEPRLREPRSDGSDDWPARMREALPCGIQVQVPPTTPSPGAVAEPLQQAVPPPRSRQRRFASNCQENIDVQVLRAALAEEEQARAKAEAKLAALQEERRAAAWADVHRAVAACKRAHR